MIQHSLYLFGIASRNIGDCPSCFFHDIDAVVLKKFTQMTQNACLDYHVGLEQ